MKKIVSISIIACLVILGSCKKDDNTPTVNKGTLSGTIAGYDDKTVSNSDASGFTVALIPLGKTTTTDAAGKFSFSDLEYDSYDLSISKAGYGTHKVYGVNLQSSTLNVPLISMGATSTTTVTALTLNSTTYNGAPGVSYIYSTSPVPSPSNRSFTRAFLGTFADVSNTKYTAFSPIRSNQNNNVTGGFTLDELFAMGFRTGQTVFVKLYGESYFSNSYLDPSLGRTVFPNLNPNSPAAISFVVP